jgi:hypothetical protein
MNLLYQSVKACHMKRETLPGEVDADVESWQQKLSVCDFGVLGLSSGEVVPARGVTIRDGTGERIVSSVEAVAVVVI